MTDTPLTIADRRSAIAYLGDEWIPLASVLTPDEQDDYLRNTIDTIGYRAWALTGTRDNAVARMIERKRDRFLAPIIAEILDDAPPGES